MKQVGTKVLLLAAAITAILAVAGIVSLTSTGREPSTTTTTVAAPYGGGGGNTGNKVDE
ncbi:hypothetical protein [Amycolatopsis sp. NPDC004378]